MHQVERRLRRTPEPGLFNLGGDGHMTGDLYDATTTFPGQSAGAKHIARLVARLTNASTTVLLLGEGGTGKSLLARRLHEGGCRAPHPFRVVNCAALPDLIETELFGHERGAYTGAVCTRVGTFESAGEGTIFLDEIAELPLASQAKLLRALEERRFERVGSNEPRALEARVIVATNRKLGEMVATGRFREDLYYRISVVRVQVPPLRERRDDIDLLAKIILAEVAAGVGRRVEGFAPDALEAMRAHPWPGNLRELRNVIESAVVLGDGPFITLEDLPADLASSRRDRLGIHLVPRSESLGTKSGSLPMEDAISRDCEVRRDASERSRFAPGALVGNRFRIVGFLASGGMGEVYEAEDLELRSILALKCLSGGKTSTGEPLARLKREAALARRITHPNVCRVFDLGFHIDPVSGDAVAFLTMELLEGETLKARLARQGALSPRESVPLIRAMCAGLSAAHAAGVIHRDFKSSNVILRPCGASTERAVITDFGLARLEDDQASVTREGRWVGTPSNIAPEQLLGDPPTPATDVYALGVVLFEMLTGTLPFVGDTPLATANMRLLRRAPALRERRPDLPPNCNAVVARCLERHPGQRFATPERVLHALEHPASPVARRTDARKKASRAER
jgi:hypothetical protein